MLQWNDLIDALAVLSPLAIVEVSRPIARVKSNADNLKSKFFGDFLYVSFSSPAEEESRTDNSNNPDETLISKLIGKHDDCEGLHYFTKAGKLQEALSSLISNYKPLVEWEEILTSGAFGHTTHIGNTEDDEDSGEDEEEDQDFYEWLEEHEEDEDSEEGWGGFSYCFQYEGSYN